MQLFNSLAIALLGLQPFAYNFKILEVTKTAPKKVIK